MDCGGVFSGNAYPGRGILIAQTRGGDFRVAYFLTGRSDASRHRDFAVTGGELLVGPSRAADRDPLRHYVAATHARGWLVVGNGMQVREVAARLNRGEPPTVSLSDLEYEPDPPIRTSRITALLSRDGRPDAYVGAARPSRGARSAANIETLQVRDLQPGEAVLVTTYQSDGAAIKAAAPYQETTVAAEDGPALLDEVWNALDSRFRVAAAVLAPGAGPRTALLRTRQSPPD